MFIKACALILIGGASVPASAPDQAFFAILAETKAGRMAGMPPIDLSQIPRGFKLPPEALMYSGQSAKVLNIRLWSPSIAPPEAKASVAPPAGLKQGPKLDLELYRPKGGQSEESVKEFDPDSVPDYTIKIYWGSSEKVRAGQPRIFRWTDMSPEIKEAMKQRAREAQDKGSYFYKPNWTTGYWPTKRQSGAMDDDASLVGKYMLTTNYTGNVEIEAPTSVNFLAPYKLSSPNMDRKVDLKKPIVFRWDGIPYALGQFAGVMAMEGKNTMIFWSSSEVDSDMMMGDMGFLQMAEVRDFVQKTIFMPGDQTTVTCPEGIFVNADFVMGNMVAYGPGAALAEAQPLPRIQTKSTMMLMLGGKKMDSIGR